MSYSCEDCNNMSDKMLWMHNILRRLRCGKVDSFESRIKSQKVQYFAQVFDVSPSYDYNLYLRGPYSPELASDLYKLSEKKQTQEVFKFVSDELEDRFSKFKKFIGSKTIRELEIASTLHWLLNIAKYSPGESVEQLAILKNASKFEVRKAIKNIEEINQIKKYEK